MPAEQGPHDEIPQTGDIAILFLEGSLGIAERGRSAVKNLREYERMTCAQFRRNNDKSEVLTEVAQVELKAPVFRHGCVSESRRGELPLLQNG